MQRTLKILCLSIIVLTAFRGTVFRTIVKYQDIGNRSVVVITNDELIDKITAKSDTHISELNEIVKIAEQITIDELSFTSEKTTSNPNDLILSKKANCVGYSAMFNSIANFIIKRDGLQDEFEAHHKIGQLSLLGVNVHQYFDNTFFRDHDFNVIRNKKTGETYTTDPSLSDYLHISRIAKKNS